MVVDKIHNFNLLIDRGKDMRIDTRFVRYLYFLLLQIRQATLQSEQSLRAIFADVPD